MKSEYRLWSTSETTILREAVAKGMTDEQIHDLLPNRTLAAINAARFRMGLSPKRRCVMMTPELMCDIHIMKHDEHMTWKQIGERMGVNWTTLRSAYSKIRSRERKALEARKAAIAHTD